MRSSFLDVLVYPVLSYLEFCTFVKKACFTAVSVFTSGTIFSQGLTLFSGLPKLILLFLRNIIVTIIILLL